MTASVLDGIYFLTTIFENKNKNHAIVTCGGGEGWLTSKSPALLGITLL